MMRTYTLDPLWLDALDRAQCAAASLIRQLPAQLEDGMGVPEIQQVLVASAQSQGIALASPPRVSIASADTRLPFSRFGPVKLLHEALITVDLHPKLPPIAGDFARTVRYGENGRHWYYQRTADSIYARFVEQLGACRTERDAYHLALECAHQQGATLLNPRDNLGHHIPTPYPDARLMAELKLRKEWLEHRIRALVPLGLGSKGLDGGVWSLEPCLEVDRLVFRYEDAFVFQGGAMRLLGEPVEARGL